MPLYMALEKGFFKAQSLEVEIIQMNPRFGASDEVQDFSFARQSAEKAAIGEIASLQGFK